MKFNKQKILWDTLLSTRRKTAGGTLETENLGVTSVCMSVLFPFSQVARRDLGCVTLACDFSASHASPECTKSLIWPVIPSSAQFWPKYLLSLSISAGRHTLSPGLLFSMVVEEKTKFL